MINVPASQGHTSLIRDCKLIITNLANAKIYFVWFIPLKGGHRKDWHELLTSQQLFCLEEK